jgi:hypothetical protein
MKKVISILAAVFMYNICFGQAQNLAPQAQNQQTTQVQTKQVEKKEVKVERKEHNKEAKKEAKVKLEKFVGIVDSVDVANSTIKVKNINKKDDVKTFVLGSDVKVKINGKEGKLDEIKPESHIIIKYEGKIEEAKVKEINVQLKKERKEPKKEHKMEKKEPKPQTSETPKTN